MLCSPPDHQCAMALLGDNANMFSDVLRVPYLFYAIKYNSTFIKLRSWHLVPSLHGK